MKQGLLKGLAGPHDLRALGAPDRVQLAAELRARITAVVDRNGGHFASNLGVVELTIALHSVFESPRDRIVWDVSHQCYAHKLLTGRDAEFDTLRTHQGLSGFCHKGESVHDTAFAGHAGTAASIALGIARGKELTGQPGHAVAVVGDASFASGMTLEALNHAGWIGQRRFILVLNDNGMSISPPVGGLDATLARSRPWQEGEDRGEVQGLFAAFGFRDYVGPVDGQDCEALLEALRGARERAGPVLVHVHTRKGAGRSEAVADPVKWHAAQGFLAPSRPAAPKGRSWTQAFAEAMIDLAREDPRLVAVTAAMLQGTGLDRFAALFPERCFDVGIAEQHATGFASGLSLAHARPVLAIYSTFLQRGYDQVIHDVALQANPLVIAMDRGGLVGADGVTHQGLFDISFLRCVPGVVLAAPADEAELRAMLRWGTRSGRVVALRFPRDDVPAPLHGGPIELALGRGEVLAEGEDVAFFAYGAMVPLALQARELLRDEGVSATVANARFAKPVDLKLLTSLLEAHQVVVTVEDHARAGGFGSACLEVLSEHRPDLVGRLVVAGVPDGFVHHAARPIQLSEAGLDPAGLAWRALAATCVVRV